jgi:hypothetical protein
VWAKSEEIVEALFEERLEVVQEFDVDRVIYALSHYEAKSQLTDFQEVRKRSSCLRNSTISGFAARLFLSGFSATDRLPRPPSIGFLGALTLVGVDIVIAAIVKRRRDDAKGLRTSAEQTAKREVTVRSRC